MKSIGRVRYYEPSTHGYVITRKWAIPEGYEDNEEMWWYRDEWLDTTNDVNDGTAFVEIYEGGQSFMNRVIRQLKAKGWRVILRR